MGLDKINSLPCSEGAGQAIADGDDTSGKKTMQIMVYSLKSAIFLFCIYAMHFLFRLVLVSNIWVFLMLFLS